MKAKHVLFAVVTLFMLGFVYPFLFSMPSYVTVGAGIALVLVHIFWAYLLAKPYIGNAAVWLFILIPVISSCSKVPAGHKGVKVYLLGGEKGVDSEELGVGRYWIGINEELYLFPTFTQNYVWTKGNDEGSPNDEAISFQTMEGLEVSADIGISYHIDPSMVTNVFQKYRRGIDEITDVFLRNEVRDAFNKLTSDKPVESVYGEGKNELLEEVNVMVAKAVSPYGIVLEKVYLVGTLRLPETVVTALNSKIEATQRAQQRENELREAEAQAKKQIAEAEGQAKSITVKAEAEAQANRLVSNSLTQTLVEYEKVKRWDGKLPQVTSDAGVLLNLNK